MQKRDENGRFAKGNGGGPGRPKKKTEERYLRRLSSRVTLAKWQKIVDRAIQDAEKGDARARQWLSDYLMGKPPQRLEHTGKDDKPLFEDVAKPLEQS